MNTPVIFRKWRSEGDIIALFPTIPADYAGLYCQSYMHIGQHGSANYSLVLQQTRLAKLEEYAELLSELIARGYDDLKVYRRFNRSIKIDRSKILKDTKTRRHLNKTSRSKRRMVAYGSIGTVSRYRKV